MDINIKLSAYEWHLLLKELEHQMCVVNRDTSTSKKLWERIAKQLNSENDDVVEETADE